MGAESTSTILLLGTFYSVRPFPAKDGIEIFPNSQMETVREIQKSKWLLVEVRKGCVCFAVLVPQPPGEAEAAEMAFLGVLEVSEGSSSVQAVNQECTAKPNQTLLMLHMTGIRGSCGWGSSSAAGMVTAVGKGLELLSGGIHVGKPGIRMMPLLINNRQCPVIPT